MRVLWVGDACCSSGFARCTHAVCDELHARGHEVNILALNYFGDPHDRPYDVYPARQPLDHGRDIFGVSRLPHLAARLEPDVIVLLNDPWNVPAYLQTLNQEGVPDCPVVGWLAVDARNQASAAAFAPGSEQGGLDRVVTWTKWGADQLREGGYDGPTEIVPLGVDGELFRPEDRATCRRVVLPEGVAQDCFLVGAVGRNQWRKRLDLAISYFAEWVHEDGVEDAYLFIHSAPTGEASVDLRSLTLWYDLRGRVMISEPPVGPGQAEERLVALYNSLDVYVSTSQGEGWGLPALEAMACGTPCILPFNSAYQEWAHGAARLVPCDRPALNAPLNGTMHTLGSTPGKAEFVAALRELYNDRAVGRKLAQAGEERAAALTWGETARRFAAMLEKRFSAQEGPS